MGFDSMPRGFGCGEPVNRLSRHILISQSLIPVFHGSIDRRHVSPSSPKRPPGQNKKAYQLRKEVGFFMVFCCPIFSRGRTPHAQDSHLYFYCIIIPLIIRLIINIFCFINGFKIKFPINCAHQLAYLLIIISQVFCSKNGIA